MKPTPTAPQQEAIEQEILNKTTQQAAASESAALQDDVIAQKQLIDNAFSDLFDYYNTDIISQYDSERRAINGTYVIAPVTEADLTAVAANPPSGRLVPTPPASDIVRIDEFDAAGYSGLDSNNELQHIINQGSIEDSLVNGVSGTNPVVTASSVTTSALTSSSTTLNMLDDTGPMSFAVGNVFVVYNGSDAAVVEVTSVTDNMGGDPDYDFTLGIIVRVAPTGTINPGADVIDNFSGFNNTERTNKVASNSNLQPIMNTLISNLESELTARLSNIVTQLVAIGSNLDPDALAELFTAQTEATNTDTFIDNYLLTTDISDTGIGTLSAERASRTSFLNTRISQILANYTGQTENYYDFRYSIANDRANTQRGTLRELRNAENVKTSMLNLASGLQNSIDALNNIIA